MQTSAIFCLLFVALATSSALSLKDEKLLAEVLERLAKRGDSDAANETMGISSDGERTLMEARQNCDTQGSFSGMEYGLRGYDVLAGYPLAPGRDPGFGGHIFMSSFEPAKYTMDCRYMIPVGFDFYQDVACQTSFTSKEVKSQSDFAASLGVTANVNGGGWGVSFSANTEYKTAVQQMSNRNAIYIISTASCKYFSIRLKQMSPPPFEPDFLASVRDLASTDNMEKYFNFFAVYGTHYVKDITFGARYTKQHKMTQEGYRKAQQSSLSVSVQASYEGAFSVGGGAGVDSSVSSAVEEFKQNVETTTITVGAQPSSGGVNDWASTVKETPMPMQYELGSIENIFTDTFFKNTDIDYGKVKANILQYKNGYCRSLMAQGVVSSCDAIPPPPENVYQQFEVILYISTIEYSTSGNPVDIKLIGTDGTCTGLTIDTKKQSGAVRGSVSCSYIGELKQVYLYKSGDDGLHINFVAAKDKSSGLSYVIQFGNWLENEAGYSPSHTLSVDIVV